MTAVDLVLSPFDASAVDMVTAAVRAEREGLADGVWTYDHLVGTMLGRGRSHDPFPILGAVAAATERVRVGPLVANMMNRHPVTLTLAAATLQSLSGGRAVIGIGAGPSPGSRFAGEHEAIGTDLLNGPDRCSYLAESIALIRSMWSHDEDDGGADGSGAGAPERRRGVHRGRWFTVDALPDLVGDEPRPPIVVGAAGPVMTALALDHADGLNLRFGPDTATLVTLVDEQRPPGFELSVHIDVGVTTADDRHRLLELAPMIDRITVGVASPFDLDPMAEIRSAVHT